MLHLPLPPMKVFAFFMAVLVLVLSVMPCGDKGSAEYSDKVKTEIAKSAAPQSDPQQGNCSPFCHCTCCAGFSINHFIAAIFSLQPYTDKANAAYLSDYPVEVTIPIWQPPKLSATIIS